MFTYYMYLVTLCLQSSSVSSFITSYTFDVNSSTRINFTVDTSQHNLLLQMHMLAIHLLVQTCFHPYRMSKQSLSSKTAILQNQSVRSPGTKLGCSFSFSDVNCPSLSYTHLSASTSVPTVNA